jgi:hypothetical protein
MLRRVLLPALVLATSVPACDDLPHDPDGEALDGGSCVEKASVLAGIDAASALGFSAADLLVVAEGSHTSGMKWAAGLAEGPVTVSFGPESGAGELTVTIAHAGGEVRFIDSSYADNGGLDGGYAECDDRLEVDVDVTVTTAGGAFSESFTAPLRATSRGIGRILHEIAVDEFAGSFAVTELAPSNAELGPVELTIGVSESGLFGGATTIVEMSDGEVASAGFVDVARWPATGSACESYEVPLGLDAAVADFSAADALALVAAAGDLELAWQGSAPTAMTLELVPGAVACATDSGEWAGQLRIPAEATVATADGRWSGTFAVEVLATAAADRSLASAYVQIPAPYAATVPAADFLAAYGIADVDLTGYDEAALDFSGEFLPDAAVSGSVTVLGVKLHMCSDEPGAGCEGNDYTELTTATFKNP